MKSNQKKSRSILQRARDLCLALGCCILLWTPAQAQMVPSSAATEATVEIPDQLTRQQARDLVARLSDAEVRALIIAELDKRATAAEKRPDSDAYVSQLLHGIRVAMESMSRIANTSDQIWPALFQSIKQRLTDNGRIGGWQLLMQFVGLMLAGWAAAALAARLFKRIRPTSGDTSSTGSHIDLACFGLMRGLVHLAAFGGGAAVFVEISTRQIPAAEAFWMEVVWCLVLLQLVALAARQLASPTDDGLVPASAKTAQQVLTWSIILSAALILPDPVIKIAIASGASSDTVLLMAFFVGAAFIGLVIVVLVRLRHFGAAFILGEDGSNSSLRQGLARSWWIMAIVYVLVVWMLAYGKRAATGESSLIPGIGSLAMLALLPYLDRGLRALITWYFTERHVDDSDIVPSQETEAIDPSTEPVAIDEPAAEIAVSTAHPRAPAYIATTLRYARVVMVLVALSVFARLWEIDVRALVAQLIGERVSSALFDIGITVLLTWALWGIIRISIERQLDDGKSGEDGEQEEEAEAGGLGGTRVETVLPLIRMFIKITLIVMAVLISLSSLGVNIGPLIAGAGVIGIAIGFGAQTLVRDIVSGFFYLLDDAFRIGEYVVINNIRGTVEKISIRSFQLRHHEGPVHTVPYGEIQTLTNWSRDWAIMKFELRIAFETDIDMVRKLIKRIGIEMMEDPEFGPMMLAPMKSQGVNRMDDSALIIRCKFTAIPGQQYLIRREAFTRIQRVFEEKGIQFAPRRVLVEATTPTEAVKAAAAVLDEEKPADPSKPPPM